METGPEAYRDQIENWMATVCDITFGDSSSVDPKEPDR